MTLSSITICGMHNVKEKTYDLSGFHYFYGENGVGKSTVMQAIQLALLGYIPGTDKTKSAIFQHSNCPEMLVSLNLKDNGNTINIIRKWTKKGKTINSECAVNPATFNVDNLTASLDLPICNFSEFLSMTANKQKDWFIHFLPTSDEKIDWDKLLNEAISDFGKILDIDFVNGIINYAEQDSLNSNGIENVRNLNSYLKDQQSMLKSELGRLQNTVQSLIFYDDCDNGTDLEELQHTLNDAKLLLNNCNEKKIKLQQNREIEVKISKIASTIIENYNSEKSIEDNPDFISAQNKAKDIQSKLKDLEQKALVQDNAEIDCCKQMSSIERILNGDGICPYTKACCQTITEQFDTLKKDKETLKENLEHIHEIQSTLKDGIQGLEKDKISYDKLIEQMKQEYLSYSIMLENYHNDVADLSIEQIENEIAKQQEIIQKVQDIMVKVEANKKYEKLISNITNDKYKVEQNIEILKVWIKLTDVNGLQSKITEAPFKALESKMTVYLQKFFANTSKFEVAKFHLEEKANSFSFGAVTPDGDYISYDLLSSGEKCLYALSLMLGILEISKSPLKLILIDDLLDHLDPERIKDCFETLYAIDTVQVILAGVQKCTHENAEEFVTEII